MTLLEDVEARRELNSVAGAVRPTPQLPSTIEVFSANPGPLLQEPVAEVDGDVVEALVRLDDQRAVQ
jgi:hypothetical protein